MYYALKHKTKQFFWLMIKLAIVVGCIYFIYTKLTENKQLHFSDFYQNLIKNNVFSFKNTYFLLILTFFNWFLEILKWETLASFCTKINKKSAAIQSFASLTTSLITPNRVGEYGAKALYFDKPYRKKIVGLNLVGNFYQMLMTVVFGLIGFGYFILKHKVEIDLHRIFRFLLLSLFVFSAFFFGAKHFSYRGYSAEKAKKFIKKIPFKLNLKVIILSLLRFLIFSHQFYFLTLIFNTNIDYLNTMSAIFSVYFIASLVPMLSVFDVVLKSTVAVWVFAYLNVASLTILTITTVMWILNFVLPAIIGSYFVLRFKPLFTT